MGPIVLLVEDREEDRELTARAVKKAQTACELVMVETGEAALEYLSTADPAPQLVLLDIRLPGISGFDVLKRMRDIPAAAALPVVMLTSSNLEEDRIASLQAGAASYIRKPVTSAHFQDVIDVTLLYWLVHDRRSRSEGRR
jgi:two-component system response regulator